MITIEQRSMQAGSCYGKCSCYRATCERCDSFHESHPSWPAARYIKVLRNKGYSIVLRDPFDPLTASVFCQNCSGLVAVTSCTMLVPSEN